MNLQERIFNESLNEIRENLKREKGNMFNDSEINILITHSGSYNRMAAFASMAVQTDFHRWAMLNWWIWEEDGWNHKLNGSKKTELELYDLWRVWK